MTKGRKGLILLTLVGLFVLALGTGAMAKVGDMPFKATGGAALEEPGFKFGDATPKEPTTPLLDLPALHFVRDANGRVCGDLPALKMCSKAHPSGAKKLPKTGANVGDLFAAGMAALGAGGVLARRVRFSLAG